MTVPKSWPIAVELSDVEGGGAGGGVDIGSIITSSIADIPRGDEGGEESMESEGAPPPAEATEPSPDAAEETELAQLEQELLGKNPNLKGQITVPRHQAVLTRQRNQAKAEHDALQAQLKEIEWARDPEVKASLEALALADSDPQKFISLLTKDPRYADLLRLQTQRGAEAEAKSPGSNGRPKPNATTADGQYTYYDDEGLQQLLEWHGQQVTTKAEEALFKKVEDRFGPVEQEFKARNMWNQSLEKQRGVLDNARAEWPGFKEHEKAIGEALFADKRISLETAYRNVVVKALQEQTKTNRAQVRKELLAEMDQKPRAVVDKPGAGVERTVSEGPASTGDIIRKSLRQVER